MSSLAAPGVDEEMAANKRDAALERGEAGMKLAGEGEEEEEEEEREDQAEEMGVGREGRGVGRVRERGGEHGSVRGRGSVRVPRRERDRGAERGGDRSSFAPLHSMRKLGHLARGKLAGARQPLVRFWGGNLVLVGCVHICIYCLLEFIRCV